MVVRPAEQIIGQEINRQYYARSVIEAGLSIDGAGELNGSEDHAPTADRVIPVGINKDAAVRTADVLGRSPDPAGMKSNPVTRLPRIIASIPDPMPGDPDLIRSGRVAGRAGFEAFWRNRQIGQLVHQGR